MTGFYITKLVVSGIGLPDSIIELKDGVNIIYGPSNTGKTYVIKCIDYMFGADNLPIDEGSGYDMIALHICSRSGGTCVIRRKLNERKVSVDNSSIDNIEEKLLSEQTTKLDQLNQEGQRLSDKSRALLQTKIIKSDKLHELEYMRDRFAVLAKGYQADIERLEFIIEGEIVRPKESKRVRCPFCSGEIQPKQHKSLAFSAEEELKDVKTQLTELQTVIDANIEEIQKLQEHISALEAEQEELTMVINATYKMQVAETQTSIRDLEELQLLINIWKNR